MRKGEMTRNAILTRATVLATRVGLEGVTIGRLADELDLSKSGLFAHFRSKEALQIQVLQHAADHFTERVIHPALAAPRGEPRLRSLFEGWLSWAKASQFPGGCLFVAAATELDDRPGPVREQLVLSQRQWMQVLATSYRGAVREGHFHEDGDADQFAHDLYGVMLAYYHSARLLSDPAAEKRARAAFEGLLAAARTRSPAAARPNSPRRRRGTGSPRSRVHLGGAAEGGPGGETRRSVSPHALKPRAAAHSRRH